MVVQDAWGAVDPDEADLEVPGADRPPRAYNQIGPFAITPTWILDPDLYLPGVPDPAQLKRGDERPLTSAEIRVYIALKSYANTEGYARPHVSTIADRAKVDKSSAERAIAKFRRLGWVTAKRKYRDDGSIRGCDYWVLDVCPEPRTVTTTQGVPAASRVPHPRTGGDPTREAAGAKNSPLERTTRTDQGVEQSSTTSDRFAPSGGGDTKSDDRSWAARDLNVARRSDLALFEAHVGAKLFSTGAKLKRGTFSSRQVYKALMAWKIKKKPIEWPGRLVDTIDNDGIGDGVEYFLLSYGLEKVDE